MPDDRIITDIEVVDILDIIDKGKSIIGLKLSDDIIILLREVLNQRKEMLKLLKLEDVIIDLGGDLSSIYKEKA